MFIAKGIIYIIIEFSKILQSCYLVLRYSKRTEIKVSGTSFSTKRCIVLGNGPSLLKTLSRHKKLLKNIDIFCVNSFVLSEFFTILKPKYCVFADPAYWSKSASKSILDTVIQTVKDLEKKVDWPLFIYLPFRAKKWNHFIALQAKNSNIIIYYYNITSINCIEPLKYLLYKLNFAMVPCQNVLIPAIFLGLNMGYKEVFIAGADHSWHESINIDSDNKLYLNDYKINSPDKRILTPYYISDDESKTFRMHEILLALSNTFKSYHELERYACHLKKKIFNISERSFIDAFER